MIVRFLEIMGDEEKFIILFLLEILYQLWSNIGVSIG